MENVRKFRIIPKELDHEDGELTATQKLKRAAMEEMFRDLIDEMLLVVACGLWRVDGERATENGRRMTDK